MNEADLVQLEAHAYADGSEHLPALTLALEARQSYEELASLAGQLIADLYEGDEVTEHQASLAKRLEELLDG